MEDTSNIESLLARQQQAHKSLQGTELCACRHCWLDSSPNMAWMEDMINAGSRHRALSLQALLARQQFEHGLDGGHERCGVVVHSTSVLTGCGHLDHVLDAHGLQRLCVCVCVCVCVGLLQAEGARWVGHACIAEALHALAP